MAASKTDVLKYVTPGEIREELVLRLERRLLDMAKATCKCDPSRETEHEMGCPGYYREDDARIARLVLEEVEEDEE